MRYCLHCNNHKVEGSFAKHAWCRDCTKAYNRQRKIQDRDKLNAQKLQWQSANPKKRHAGQMKSKFGLQVGEYDKMLAAQNGVCAICKLPEEVPSRWGTIKSLAVDHSHITGEVRSLLCQKCNQALGLMREDFDAVLSLAKYIQRHNNII